MRILPKVTQPWPGKIDRRHTPKPASGDDGYILYRACLRWEFGFYCAFCLTHEADLTPNGPAGAGVEGTGLFGVEHFIPKSNDSTLRNVYANCFYCCRFCNAARGSAPNRDRFGRRLLNPCEQVWGEAFARVKDELRPRDTEDVDAVYTREAYDFDEPRKVFLRKFRRENLAFIEESVVLERNLLDLIAGPGKNEAKSAIKRLRAWRRFLRDRFKAIPSDHPTACRCGHTRHHAVPVYAA